MEAQPRSQHPRVMFRTPEEQEQEKEEKEEEKEEQEEEKEEKEQEERERPPQRRLGRLTIRYDRRDLQRRLDVEQWAESQLQLLFDCDQEEEQLQIDIDELLDLSDSDQRSRLNTLLQQRAKPAEDFINGLLIRIKGLSKMSPQHRK